jgi:hypothetical protein
VTRFVLKGRITGIYQPERTVHKEGAGKDAVLETEKLGWYVTVDFLNSFYVGNEKPPFKVGDAVSIILQPDTNPTADAPAPTPQVQRSGDGVTWKEGETA